MQFGIRRKGSLKRNIVISSFPRKRESRKYALWLLIFMVMTLRATYRFSRESINTGNIYYKGWKIELIEDFNPLWKDVYNEIV